jgi:hypothetical protein
MITTSAIAEITKCETNWDLWGIIAFEFLIIAVLIYCLVRERKLIEEGLKLRKLLYSNSERKNKIVRR